MKTKIIITASILTLNFAPGILSEAEGQNSQVSPLKYVKIEIDHRGLHCPFLGVALK